MTIQYSTVKYRQYGCSVSLALTMSYREDFVSLDWYFFVCLQPVGTTILFFCFWHLECVRYLLCLVGLPQHTVLSFIHR